MARYDEEGYQIESSQYRDREFADGAGREVFAKAEFPAEIGLKSSRLPLSQQEKSIAELHETINQLASKLKPVLTPVNEAQDRNMTDEAKDIASPLADQLNANNRGIRRASESLRGIMERLEC